MTQHTATLRPATPEDGPAIARVQIQAWRETYAGLVPDEFLARMVGEERRERAAQGWARAAADPRQVLLVAEEAGEVVGFVAGGPARALPEDGPEYGGELYALYLLRACQGRGSGRALVRELARRLSDLGQPDLMLWVLRENPTRGFYEHLGGVVVGEKRETVPGGELVEVAYGWPDIRALAG